MSETLITDWHGCYEGGWQGMIAAEAFCHPAKFSYALICRIVRHGLDQGYWHAGGNCIVTEKIRHEIIADLDSGRYNYDIDSIPTEKVTCGSKKDTSQAISCQSGQSLFASTEATAQEHGSRQQSQTHGDLEPSLFGNSPQNSQSQTDSSSTTSTKTPSTTESKTSPVSSVQDTPPAIEKHLPKRGKVKSYHSETSSALSAEACSRENTSAPSVIATNAVRSSGAQQSVVTSSGYVVNPNSPPGVGDSVYRVASLLGDPFGGVATGGIVCGYHGLNWVGCELEPRFVELGNKNLAMHGPNWMALKQATYVRLLQGDSRQFSQVVGAGCLSGVVSSPPWESSSDASRTCNEDGTLARQATSDRGTYKKKYGSTSGQIGDLKSGDIDAVITSPPFGDSERGGTGVCTHPEDCECNWCAKNKGNAGASQGGKWGTKTDGQIGSLKAGSLDGVISSPPFADSDTKPTKLGSGKGTRADGDGAGRNKGDYIYGDSHGQIGALKSGSLDGVISSPPYEGSVGNPSGGRLQSVSGGTMSSKAQRESGIDANYGQSDGQIGHTGGETYWQAMHAVYSSMRDAMKPGGIAAIVVKDYVKAKARVPLCDQTCTLLESIGFDVFERCRCWLVKERREPSLFGGEHVTTTERKSFFRRLAEKKGSPRIDWEEVIWCRK